MANTKTEVIFVELSDNDQGFNVSHDIHSTGEISTFLLPSIGDHLALNLAGKNFSGRVVHKRITYSQKDIADKPWDFVTTVVLTIERFQADKSEPLPPKE